MTVYLLLDDELLPAGIFKTYELAQSWLYKQVERGMWTSEKCAGSCIEEWLVCDHVE